MTEVRELGPLDYRIAITDQQGRPSPEFQRRWDAQRINNGLFVTLTFGTGAPTDPATRDGSEYIDTSTTPYTLYVVRTGAWHKVGPYAFTDLSDVPHSYSGAGLKLVRVNAGATALEFSTIAAALDSIGSTQGDILYRNATGWTVLPPGTASQLLQTGGASANPSWVNAPTSLPSIANNTLLANTSGSAAVPVSTTLTALIDSALGSAQGDIIYRSASGWVVLTPGTSGYLLATGGASANPSWTAPITAANPTATASDTAVNGTATTFMRSDASPAVQKGSSTQFGVLKVDGTTITATSGVISSVSASGANPSATASDTAVNGTATTFMRSDASPAIQKGSSSQFGVLKVDGTTITASSGVISGVAGTTNNYYAGALVLISQQTPSGTGVVTFTNIPQGYTDLVIVGSGRSTGAGTGTSSVRLTFNNDTGSNYGWEQQHSNSTAVSALQNLAQASLQIAEIPLAGDIATYQGSFIVDIPTYTGTTFNKSLESHYTTFNNTTTASLYDITLSGHWASTAAVSRVDLTLTSGNFVAGSTISLYGRGGSNVTVNPQPGLPVISETITSGSQSSVTISSIPSTYRDLRIQISGRGTNASGDVGVKFVFNSDTGANYNDVGTLGTGTIIQAQYSDLAATSLKMGFIPAASAPSNWSGQLTADVANYAGTTFYKSVKALSHDFTSASSGSLAQYWSSGLWASTSAITSVTISLTSGNFTDGTVVTVYGIGGSPTATLPVVPPQGRLTLTSGAPVMTADATAQGTIYYAPYVGTLLPVGNIMYRFSQLSYVLNTTAHTSTNLYDVFAYNSSGTITLATGPAWTNSTTRSNAISQDATNGIWVNTSSITLNLSGGTTTTTVAAGQATYLGTFYATANGQTGMAFQPAAASGGTNNILGLFNAYNRLQISALVRDSTSSWTYGTASWRASDNSNSNRVSYVDGLQLITPKGEFTITANANVSSNGYPNIGMSLDSTTATPNVSTQTNNTVPVQMTVMDRWFPQIGFHYIQAQERNDTATNAVTFYGGQTARQLHALRVDLEM